VSAAAATIGKDVGGRLAALLRSGAFAVTGEIVPPRSANGDEVTRHARGQVGYVDAANITDNPTASAHMSPVAGASFVTRAGIEPTLQLTVRDRNRLAITADLLGGWAVGARNLLCLSGDPIHVGDHPDATVVNDLDVLSVVRLAKNLRETGTTLAGSQIAEPPRFLIGVADVPLADPYEPSRLEQKLDAGADVIWTQIAYDVDALSAWADRLRSRGVFERAKVLIGVVPLRTAKGARFMDEKLPGVRVPARIIEALDAAGDDSAAVGVDLTVDVIDGIRGIDGVSGIHLMGMGHDEAVRAVVERSGLFPRPTGAM
jgi:methylenetetrahydrofolate reductase (NADPH)